VAAVASWDKTRTCFQLEEEDDVLLHITPWTLQVFQGILKTAQVLYHLML
jgi:hypothetical protein